MLSFFHMTTGISFRAKNEYIPFQISFYVLTTSQLLMRYIWRAFLAVKVVQNCYLSWANVYETVIRNALERISLARN